MSTIITYSTQDKMPCMKILATQSRTIIVDTDFEGWLFDITGSPDDPFIIGVRLSNCKIIADNLMSFKDCFFDESCELLLREQPVFNGYINHNRVCIHDVAAVEGE
jgi:hypothetical protein